jgi:hypothetical protein
MRKQLLPRCTPLLQYFINRPATGVGNSELLGLGAVHGAPETRLELAVHVLLIAHLYPPAAKYSVPKLGQITALHACRAKMPKSIGTAPHPAHMLLSDSKALLRSHSPKHGLYVWAPKLDSTELWRRSTLLLYFQVTFHCTAALTHQPSPQLA